MRTIDYIRISVTDRCNLRCVYCMPENGVDLLKHQDMMSFEEIYNLILALVPAGIKKIRLTGGEPLVRNGIEKLIKMLRSIPEIEDITLTTNGILLEEMAEGLKAAGLSRINVSLDSLDEIRFKQITRWGSLEKVLKGIDKAIDIGLKPVKINVVAIKGFNDDEFINFVEYAYKKEVQVRFIELMPIGESDDEAILKHYPIADIKELIETKFQLEETSDIKTNGPAENYRIIGGKGSVGFIGALSHKFCSTCNRLRLTADGRIRPCLYIDKEYDVLKLIRDEASPDELRAFVEEIILGKPEGHNMEDGWGNQRRKMSQIGG
ncbi:MAG: molybdenum cofactor biosynthesis protein A [Fusobacteria bacterium]|nr:MAG: molybdenum cofactor biosynthesis protein A [Fusobacteriota bacterium]KAF0229643.1 MAG: molybdenum cofactor biosynthesis protein [Fusobacteriota bacterium]